jgi:hypothetical protein
VGRGLEFRSAQPFFSYRLGSIPVFRRGEERGEPQTNPGRALLCLSTLDLKNPFGRIVPPLHKEPKIRYLLLADIRRLLAYLKSRQNGLRLRSRFSSG